MKGTIDITIKRKDGTVEKRQEHNVAFDLPAFILKEYLKNPAIPMYACGVHMGSLKMGYRSISLSEEERSLTKPEWRPRALRTITSGTSSWNTVLSTPVDGDKKRTVAAAWIMPEEEGFSLTLKSIAFDNINFLPPAGSQGSVNSSKTVQMLHISGLTTLRYSRAWYGKKLKPTDFNFTKAYLDGFSTAESPYNSFEKCYLPYSIGLLKTVSGEQVRTKDGRFAFVNSDGVISGYAYPSGPYTTLAIYDDTTGQQVLSFPISQFTNYAVNSSCVYVLNTGAKNWLIQYYNSTICRIWQIPDTQTSDAIAPTSETFLPGVAFTTLATDNVTIGIIGNYIINSGSVYKIADDLTVTTFKGCAAGSELCNPCNYNDIDYMAFYDITAPGAYSSYMFAGNNERALMPYFANLTASNFSTPITLGAGDVLSVSYSISVV